MKLTGLLLVVLAVVASQSADIDAVQTDRAQSDRAQSERAKTGAEKTVVESALVTVIALCVERFDKVRIGTETRKWLRGLLTVALAVDLTHDRAKVEFEIARKQAKNDLKIRLARKSTEVARTELKRAIESVEKYKKSVSETEIDRLRLSAERSELEIDQALHEQEAAQLTSRLKEIEMELAKQAVDRRALVSPIAGMVVQVNLHQGEWVPAGKAVVRVLRVDRLRVEGFVQSKKATGDLVERRVTLTVDLGGKAASEFEGIVVFVSPEVNPVNGQVRVWAEVENKKLLLRPGLRGNLTIHPETAQTAKRERP